MITIVAHGIMGTAYRQDVVVGNSDSGNIQVLRDIRRQLSIQYGDDTPMTGWAFQTAPGGMWLSRIERAFDANYASAYIMVSFLILRGQRLRSEAIQFIEHCLIENHAKYMQHSVVLHEPDWSFLIPLEPELRGWIEYFDPSSVIYRGANSQGSAYWPGDIHSMLENIWDVRFGGYSIIYCGKRIIASGKEFPRIDDKVVNKSEVQTPINEGKSTAEPLRIVNEPRLHPLDDGNELLKRHKEAIRLRNRHRIRHSEESEEISRQEMRRKKTKFRILFTILTFFVVLVVVYLRFVLSGNDNNSEDKVSVTVEHPVKEREKLVISMDSLRENDVIPVTVDDESQNEKDGEQITNHEQDEPVPSPIKSPSIEKGKIRIMSSDKLFHILTWENVKNGGTGLYEKYEVGIGLRSRIHNIVMQAQRMGKARYQLMYRKVSTQREHEGRDKLFFLEREIMHSSKRELER